MSPGEPRTPADDGPLESDGTELVVVAVPMAPSAVARIDREVARESERTGGDHTREEFVRRTVLKSLDRFEGQRWAARERGERE